MLLRLELALLTLLGEGDCRAVVLSSGCKQDGHAQVTGGEASSESAWSFGGLPLTCCLSATTSYLR